MSPSRLTRSLALVALIALLVGGVPTASASAAETPGISAAVARPGPLTTGVPAGTRLRVWSGDLRITTYGTVIDGYDIRGIVWVEAANVTIKNSVVRGRRVTGNLGLINAQSAAVKNLSITNVELAPTVPQVYLTGVYGHDLTLRNTNIHHVVDAVHLLGGNVRIFRSWFHDLSHFPVDARQNSGPTRNEDIQIQAGTDFWFKDNVLSGAQNAAMLVTQGRGAVSTILFENNIVEGGACSVDIAQKGGAAAISGVTVRDNVFGTSRDDCNLIIDESTLSKTVVQNNARVDAKSLAITSRTSTYLTTPGNFRGFHPAASPYSAFSSMWGVYIPGNDIAFTNDLRVNPAVFPSDTRFTWNVTPDSATHDGVNGYLHSSYGNYDNSAGQITPRQVSRIGTFTAGIGWTYAGDPSSGLLSELWLSSHSAVWGSFVKTHEVGFFPKMSVASIWFVDHSTAVGTGSFTSNGVVWNVRRNTSATGEPYFMAYRPGYLDFEGELPYDDYLDFLVAAGAITGDEWVNGVAFGVEPHSGEGSLTIDRFAVALS